jgi:sRNA-binding carbon storage regulator CsrA
MLIISRCANRSFFVGEDYFLLKMFDTTEAVIRVNMGNCIIMSIGNPHSFNNYSIEFVRSNYKGQAAFKIDAPRDIKILRSELLFMNNEHLDLQERLTEIDIVQAEIAKKIAEYKKQQCI